MPERDRSSFPWWGLVPGAVTLFLIAFNSPWFRMFLQRAYYKNEKAFSLSTEMNFAVWWSAVILLLSALIFWEIASSEARHQRRAYLGLSLLMTAMAIDEVGSLHEWVSGIGGWTALAPFGLFGILLLGDSLRRLWPDEESRPVFWLVLIGFLFLASVALQEYAEHNWTSVRFGRRYGRFLEESTELVGAWFILFGAVFRRQGNRWGGSLGAVVPDPTRMQPLTRVVIIGFLVQVAAAQLLLLDVGEWNGSLAAIYPLAVFLLLACYAFCVPLNRPGDLAHVAELRGFWNATGFFFLICSIGTMQHFWPLIGRYVPGLSRNTFFQKVPLWILLIIVAWFIGLALWRRRDWRLLWLLAAPLGLVIRLQYEHVARKDLSLGLFACVCAVALMRPDRWARGREPGQYGPESVGVGPLLVVLGLLVATVRVV